MTRHNLPAGIPCGVCLATIDGWTPDGETSRAHPCGHSVEQIGEVGAGMTRVEFGRYADAPPVACPPGCPVPSRHRHHRAVDAPFDRIDYDTERTVHAS